MTAKKTEKINKSETKVERTSHAIKKRRHRVNKRSIHATTPAQNLENRIKNEEKVVKKVQKRKIRSEIKETNVKFIEEQTQWAYKKKTYKIFIRHLPSTTTCQDLVKHFDDLDVHIVLIKLFVHKKTEQCLGWAFMEFNSRLEFEVALTKNCSLIDGRNRIIVEGTLRNFMPSKRKAQKIVVFDPNKMEL